MSTGSVFEMLTQEGHFGETNDAKCHMLHSGSIFEQIGIEKGVQQGYWLVRRTWKTPMGNDIFLKIPRLRCWASYGRCPNSSGFKEV